MKQVRLEPGPRYHSLLQVLRTSEVLWNASRLFFASWDLSPSQFNVLNLLAGFPEGQTQTELSEALIMHRSNVTGLVDRLEARGLVQRQEMNTDRRAYQVTLTVPGRELLNKILPLYFETAERVWGTITTQRASHLAGELQLLASNAERVSKSTDPNLLPSKVHR